MRRQRRRCPVRPGWAPMNALTGTGGASRKSPVEIFATAASVVTRSPYAEVTGIKHGKLGRWTDGVAALRAAPRRVRRLLGRAQRPRAARPRTRPQSGGDPPTRCGSSSATRPRRASARPARTAATSARRCTQLRRTTGQPLAGAQPVGLRRADPRRARRPGTAARRPAPRPRHLRRGRERHPVQLAGQALQRPARRCSRRSRTTPCMLDLPLLSGFWGIVGRMSVPYITRINRVIREVADRAEPAGRRGQQALHPAVGRQVLRRQLPPEPGRLPRLVQGAGRSPHPGPAAAAAA